MASRGACGLILCWCQAASLDEGVQTSCVFVVHRHEEWSKGNEVICETWASCPLRHYPVAEFPHGFQRPPVIAVADKQHAVLDGVKRILPVAEP